MIHPSRRAVLSLGAGLLVAASGCLDTAEAPTTDDESDGDDDADAESEATDPTLESYDAVSFQQPDVPTEPTATLFADSDAADRWLDDRNLDDEGLVEFVDETGFDTSVVVGLEAQAPDLCHELRLEEVALETDAEDDATLAIEAAVSDESGETEACAYQVTTVGQFVRATFADDPVTRAAVTITDHEGREYERGVAVESASESDSGTDGGSETGTDADAGTDDGDE